MCETPSNKQRYIYVRACIKVTVLTMTVGSLFNVFLNLFFSRHFIIKCSIQYVVYVGSNIQQIMMDNSQCYTVTLPDHNAFCE